MEDRVGAAPESPGSTEGLRNAKRFPWHCGGPVDPADRPGPRTGAIDISREIRRNGGSQAIVQTGLIGVPGSGRCAPSLVVWRCTARYDGAWRRSSRCTGLLQQISGSLKQELRTDEDMQKSHEAILLEPLHPDPRRAEKELSAQSRTMRRMRSPKKRQREEWTGAVSSTGLDLASGRRRSRIVPRRGHSEGRSSTGANDMHIATLVERNTASRCLSRPRKDMIDCRSAGSVKHISKLPEES